MTRLCATLFLPLMVACLVLAAAGSGYLRTGHAIATAGLQTLVICGAGGAKAVTLGRDGAPVEPSAGACAHCAECMVTPQIAMPSGQLPPQVRARMVLMAGNSALSVRSAEAAPRPARGPPPVIGV